MIKRTDRLALLCALVGVAASGAATYVHYHLLSDPNRTGLGGASGGCSCARADLRGRRTVAGLPAAFVGPLGSVVATRVAVRARGGRPSGRGRGPRCLFVRSPLALRGPASAL